tara:strand:+ start:324 stop:500 length:177 start_codon:yes stop_codon:yes gene_type:complete
MIETKEEYEMFKALLEDNKNGNDFHKGNYLSDNVVVFVVKEVKEWEAKQALLDAYRNS